MKCWEPRTHHRRLPIPRILACRLMLCLRSLCVCARARACVCVCVSTQSRTAMADVVELLEAAEAKAYYGLAVNWKPLEALIQALLDRGVLQVSVNKLVPSVTLHTAGHA